MNYLHNLAEAIVGNSIADNLTDAMKEWEPYGVYEDNEKSDSCICGKEGIRFHHSIRNIHTGKIIEPVGSVCIKKFKGHNDELVNLCEVGEDACKAIRYLGEHPEEKPLAKSPMLTRKLIDHMGKCGVFGKDEAFGLEQASFLLNIFNRRKKLTPRQRDRNDLLMRDYIIPWLKSCGGDGHDNRQ